MNSPQQPQYSPPGPLPIHYPMAFPPTSLIVHPSRQSGTGIAGFVTGLLGLLLFWLPGLGLILGCLGIILGGVAISVSRKVGMTDGLGISGLILGIVSLVPAFLVLIALSSSGR